MNRSFHRAAMLAMSVLFAGSLGKWVHDQSSSPPRSNPSSHPAGITLDPETEAKLVEVVFDAARSDDLQTVDEYLNEGFSPNVRSARGDTLLTVAAYHDSVQVVERLLAAPEIDIEARNRMGLTAVSGAAFKGHERSLRALIAAGADVNASNVMQQTALMFASLSGRSNTVQLLLEAGADKDRADRQGQTAAAVAESQGADHIVQILGSESAE